MVITWYERVIDKDGARNVQRTADAVAALGTPVLDENAGVWRVPVTADPDTASVEVEVNDAVVEVPLTGGIGEVTIDATVPGRYEIFVVGGPEILTGVPAPQCRAVVEVR